jgi:lipoprotein-releasing system permease protein
MRRPATLLGGLVLVALGLAISLASFANAMNQGGRYALSTGAMVAGILLILAAVQRDEGAPFDPGARITEHPWSNDEQAWTLGEALGMSLWTLKKAWARLALVALPIPIASFGGAVLGAIVAPALVLQFLGPDRRRGASLVGGASGAIGAIVSAIVFAFVLPALLRLCLAALRSEKVTLADVRGPYLRHVPRLLGFGVLYTILAVLTSPLLSMLAVPFVLTPFFVVDQDLPLFPAMRKSWRVASQHFGKLWIYHVAFVPLALIGNVTILGVVLTQPLFMAGLAYAYVRLTGRVGMPYFPPEAGSPFIRRFLRLSLLVLTVIFGGLIFWVENLPTQRGSAWNLGDAAIRVGAIITGVFVIIMLLALLLPYLLDQLEGRRFTAFVAARHVRSQKSGFLTVISVLSICGVAISSCALSSVVGVMDGFSQDLKRKILGNNAHIVIDTVPGTPFADYDAALGRIRTIPGVVGATPVVHGEVMASSASNLAGVIVTGIEPGSIHSVIELAHNMEVGKLEYLEFPDKLTRLPAQEVIGIGPGGEPYYKGADLPGLPDDIDPSVRAVILNKPGRPGLILGRELAKTLHVYLGDEVTLVSPLGDLGPMGVMPRTRRFRVAGIFYSGMYEYDATYVYTMMDVAQDYFQTGQKISAIEVKVEDAEGTDSVTPQVVSALARDDVRVRDWREINKNLFSALKLERYATFIILSVAIMVASFCIVCTLLLMVTEKGKEIAILKAIGASDGMILRTFIIEGVIIGGIGTVFGVVTGLAVCTGLSWFGLRLDPEVYYIDRLPISVNPLYFLTVAIAALTICTISTLYPAYAASRLRPVDGLRDA